jgi:hypothetical protein
MRYSLYATQNKQVNKIGNQKVKFFEKSKRVFVVEM